MLKVREAQMMELKRLYQDKVIKLILAFAEEETEVRAVLINGSRVNPNAPVDIMQDYDIIFFIRSFTRDFRHNRQWITNWFGEPVIVQQLDESDNCYCFLMQFADFRIDLTFHSIVNIEQVAQADSLSMWLLDKDKAAPELPPPNESRYWVKKPEQKEFELMLNEAWWIQPYVAKGIWRNEFPYVRAVYDNYLMKAIKCLVSWDIGSRHNWQVNPGKDGKWYKKYLDSKEYADFIELYSTIDYQEIWQSLFKAGQFIRKTGMRLAENLGYAYPCQDDERVTSYLSKIRTESQKNDC